MRERLRREIAEDLDGNVSNRQALDERVASARRERDLKLGGLPTIQAAHALLRLALAASSTTMLDLPQALLIIVSDKGWIGPTKEAWRLHFKDGRSDQRLAEAAPSSADPHDWFCVAQSSMGRSSSPICVEEVQQALLAGGELVVIACDEGRGVPPMVRAAMDLVVALPSLDWSVVRNIAEHRYGPADDWADSPSDVPLPTIDPSVLLLAMRRGSTAVEYATRILRIARTGTMVGAETHGQGPRGLARVPGMGRALDWGRTLAADLRALAVGDLPWSAVDRGVLLVGPPGVGKTSYATALAEECEVPLISSSHAAWQAKGHQGDMLRAMQRSFADARSAAPCILFIDEIDSFPSREKLSVDHGDYIRPVVNALLAEIDGVTSREGVVIIGACNDAEILDPALLRAGRLDRAIEIALPDVLGRVDILRVHLGQELRYADLHQASRIADGMSGADLEKAVREARRAARTARRELLIGDLVVALSDIQGIELIASNPTMFH